MIFKTPLSSQKAEQKFREWELPTLLINEVDHWFKLLMEIESQIANPEQKLKAQAKSEKRVQKLLTHPRIGLIKLFYENQIK